MEAGKHGEHAPPEPQREVCLGRVQLKIVEANLKVLREFGKDLEMTSEAVDRHCSVRFYNGSEKVYECKIRNLSHVYQADSTVVLLRVSEGSAVVTLPCMRDTSQLLDHFNAHLKDEELKLRANSVFSLRTEEASAKQYFQFYGYLSQQQNMMQDYIRTSTYQTAVLHNTADFKDKVILDVGAGTGVLSFFTLQGGARKVYAVEASNMATYCMKLVKCNDFSDRMVVLAEKIEEVELPEQVDVIISEPMGYMLFNERMLESYLHAKKWLKPGGKMYPTQGILYVAPFSDEALYMEQMGKTYFWHQQSFHGINVSSLRSEAVEEYFRQPIVDTFDIRILMSRPIGHTTDFSAAQEQDLHKINIPLAFTSWMTGYLHGLAFWFDVAFIGSQTTVWLSTAPFQPLTHWYQVRLLLKQPLFVHEGQELGGYVLMEANERQSYDISLMVSVVGTNHQSSGTYDLKNPNFRYMSSPQPPPGTNNTNPTETYFDSQPVAGTQVQSPSQQTTIQSLPQVIRPANARSHPLKHSMGGLQTATEVIPAVNGSIISPAVQQQSPHRVPLPLSPRDHTHPSSLSHYSRHVQTRPHQQSRHMPQSHWAQPFSLQSVQNVPHSMSHHSGLQNTGYIDLGTGTAQSPSGHTHSNQYVLGSPPSGTVMYQKWPSQPAVLLHNLATHS